MPPVIDPVLRDFPDHFETERLSARCPRPGDGKARFEAIEYSLNELKPWFDWAHEPNTLEMLEIRIRNSIAQFVLRERLQFFLFLKLDGAFIGSIALHHIDWCVPLFEIGYWQHSRYTGHGYITESVNGITEFAHHILGARRIIIRCDTQNVKSKSVAERAGFTLESTVRNGYRNHDNQLRDDYVFAKT